MSNNMPTPRADPTFQPGLYVFGFTIPGMGYWGRARTYPQQSIWGIRPFGREIPGKNTENDIFPFIYGLQNTGPQSRYAITSKMCIRTRGQWAKRVIYYIKWGRQHVRRYTPYDGSPKDHLAPYSLKLMEATFLWHLLDDETKRRLDSDASRLGLRLSGWNYFTKLYLDDNPKWQEYM